MTNKLLNKKALLGFNLFEIYANFLLSLQKIYHNELTSIHGEEINSWIEVEDKKIIDPSSFTECKISEEVDEIYFQLPNRKTSIRICVSYGETDAASLDLVVGDKETYFSNYMGNSKPPTSALFLPKVIEVAKEWLDKGSMNEFAKKHFKRNY